MFAWPAGGAVGTGSTSQERLAATSATGEALSRYTVGALSGRGPCMVTGQDVRTALSTTTKFTQSSLHYSINLTGQADDAGGQRSRDVDDYRDGGRPEGDGATGVLVTCSDANAPGGGYPRAACGTPTARAHSGISTEATWGTCRISAAVSLAS